MAPKIFLTGVTGYIGGDVFYNLEKQHPDYDYTLLVRTEERGKPVKARYPNARIVYGTLDDAAVIEKAAAEADIVIHTADSADNVPSAHAIAKGLAAGHTAEKPGYWLHICGTGMLTWRDASEKRFGQPPHPDEKYDDITDLHKILSVPDTAIHRNVDKIVLAASGGSSSSSSSSSSSVRTAIVSPPTIYGPGRGPVNTRSIQVYDLVKFSMRNGWVPLVGTGKTEWDHVHVHDLADLMVSLVDAATTTAERGSAARDPELFGEHGYFFCEAGAHKWGDVSRWVADELVKQRFMAEPKVEVTTSIEDVTKDGNFAGATWGLNSKSFASRARKYLGWKPTREGLKEAIPEAVSSEAKRLGIEPQAA